MTSDKSEISRRQMGAMSMAASVVAAAGSANAALAVKETDVSIKTADGTCDAVFTHPATGTHPGVLIWPDAFGLRAQFRAFAKRLAGEGYAVLAVNPYYRTDKAPQGEGLDFTKPDERDKLMALMGTLTTERVASDAKSYVSFLDSQAAVNKSKKIGTQGYCMGGRLTMITASTVPDRVGAGASFHGGGLVTDKPDSPHKMITKMKAQYIVLISEDDDTAEPHAKDAIKAAFGDAKLPAKVEVYKGALHGWCVPDMPARYNEPLAEKAWAELLSLYKKALA